MNQFENENQTALAEKVKSKRPKKYQVIFHNDDYTPMEFVIAVLEDIFNKNKAEAEKIMLTVHHENKAIVGEYIKEIAQSKKQEVDQRAAAAGHPLRCTVEEKVEPTHSSGLRM